MAKSGIKAKSAALQETAVSVTSLVLCKKFGGSELQAVVSLRLLCFTFKELNGRLVSFPSASGRSRRVRRSG